MVTKKHPGMILCDWNMGNMSGLDLLKTISDRKLPITCGLITSECSVEMKEEAKTAGAKFHIVKPFNANHFQDALAPWLK